MPTDPGCRNTGLLLKFLRYWELRASTEGASVAGLKYSVVLLLLLCRAGRRHPSERPQHSTLWVSPFPQQLPREVSVPSAPSSAAGTARRDGAGGPACRCGCTKNPAVYWLSLEIII